jgi:hypothetical protein
MPVWSGSMARISFPLTIATSRLTDLIRPKLHTRKPLTRIGNEFFLERRLLGFLDKPVRAAMF